MNNSVKITPLGGLGEIGKNITVVETEESIIVIDCGTSFPTEETPGIEKILPDLSYLTNKQDKIKGLIITHGHEDHVGGVTYFLKKLNINVPIFATKITMEILKHKATEQNIKINPTIVKPGQKKKISNEFEVEFIHVNHSIPGSVALAIKTPVGYIVHTGDFKVDLSPVKEDVINLNRFGEIGKKGVKLLMMDSTNSENEGCSTSESVVSRTLSSIFERRKNSRIIIATFSSNINRVGRIIELADKYGRKVVLTGRSIENTVNIAIRTNIINVNKDILISPNEMSEYSPEQIVIISTGAQGEINAALNRIIDGLHGIIKIEHGDVVIISSKPIPGNEKSIDTIINKLYERGAIVYHGRNSDVHASGHANQEEQKLLLALLKPEYFMPLHGEPLHLKAVRKTAANMGIDSSKIIITKNGYPIFLFEDIIKRGKAVPHGEVYLDGEHYNELNPAVLKDRQILMNDGIVIVSASVEKETRKIATYPTINSRGFIYVNDSLSLIKCLQKIANEELESLLKGTENLGDVKVSLSRIMGRRLSQITGKSPMVIIMLNEV